MLTRRMNGSACCAPATRSVGASMDLDRLFSEFFSGAPALGGLGFAAPVAPSAPPINAWEDESNLYVEAELPGYSMDQIEATFEHGALTLRGKREAADEQRTETYLRRERSSSGFVRTVPVEADIDADAIEATLKDGVLLVTLPKSKASRARKIQVRSK